MKKILSIMLCMVLLFSACPVQNVSAAQTEYYFTASSSDSGGNYTVNLKCSPPNSIKAYAVLFDTYMHVVFAHPDTSADPAFDGQYYKTYEDGTTSNINLSIYDNWSYSEIINKIRNLSGDPVGINIPFTGTYDTNLPVFSDFNSLANYLESGDDSGLIDNNPLEDGKTYFLEWDWVQNNESMSRYLEFTIPQDVFVYGIFHESGPSFIALTFLHDGDNEILTWKYTDTQYSSSGSYSFTHDTPFLKNTEWWINASETQSVGKIWYTGDSYSTNIPIFDSKESVVEYIQDGNTGGMLNKPEYDLSVEHDFNSDVWSTDIPVPELSKISHTGFTLDNWTEDYYVDIIVSNHLSRVRMMQNASGGGVVPSIVDTAPWYSEHYWNFTLHDVLTSRAVVDINEIYGVDVQGALIEDFKNWSIEYPTIKDIQGYSWTHMGQADDYLSRHVYKADSVLSDAEQLKNSGQAQTEYYVRYVTLDGKYGQWGHYRLRDYSYNGQGERVDSGRVTAGTIDNSGKPSNTVTGSTDTSGNIDYTPIVDTNVDVNIGELSDVLNSFASGVGQLPALIGQVFTFLPWWITAMIAGVIAICITLRVLGR